MQQWAAGGVIAIATSSGTRRRDRFVEMHECPPASRFPLLRSVVRHRSRPRDVEREHAATSILRHKGTYECLHFHSQIACSQAAVSAPASEGSPADALRVAFLFTGVKLADANGSALG